MIALDLSIEQQQIVEALRTALAEAFPVARLRGAHAKSPDAQRLPTLAALGAFGLACPEDVGGVGCTVVEEMLLCVELGRFLVTPSALATALAARLAVAVGQNELVRQLVAGSKTACMGIALRDGVSVHLVDARGAEFAVVCAEEGLSLLRLGNAGVARFAANPAYGGIGSGGRASEGEGPGAECAAAGGGRLATEHVGARNEGAAPHANPELGARVASTDRSVTLHRHALQEFEPVAKSDRAFAREADLLNAAMLLGMAEASVAMAVEYAKVRTQFGQPIGAFQAIKHRCADMAIRVEALQAQVTMVAIALRDGWPDADLQVDACRLLAPRAALANARANIQVHGAMGFTAECDAHLFLLRAHLHEHLGGPATSARERLAAPSRQGVLPCK